MRKITLALLSIALLISPLAFNSQVEASTPVKVQNTINELVPTAPTAPSGGGITTYGSKPPSSSASTHNISISDYNYQVSKIGAQLYTDKFLTGKTSMRITVKNWKVLIDYGITPTTLTITLYDSSGKKIASPQGVPMDKYYNSNSVYFSGLNKSTKYYVKFSVLTNNQTYSFNGSIY